MNHYLAKLVYQIICGDGTHTAQFDEQLRFLSASNREEALQKGNAIGLQEEEIFGNDKNQLVQWKFIAVTEVHSLHKLADGAEVFSQIHETEDALSYSRFVQHKARLLRETLETLQPQTA